MGANELLLETLSSAIIRGDQEAAVRTAQKCLDVGIGPLEVIQGGGAPAMDRLGEKFQRLEIFLPELIRGGQAMKASMAVLLPEIKSDQIQDIPYGKVVIGTVSGDVHDIGKNLVSAMLAVNGFEVHDLGIDVEAKQFAANAEAVGAGVIALSALLLTTAYYQEEIINYLTDTGLREKYYVVIGGAPVTPEWAMQIGADGYGKNAVDAIQVVKRLLNEEEMPPLSRVVTVDQSLKMGG